MLTRLVAFQQADAAFPSGSFAFSNGIEGMAALEPGLDGTMLAATIEAVIRNRWAGTDRVALVQAWRADGDIARMARIDAALEAATLSEPMRVGSRRNGGALLAAHARLGTPGAAACRDRVRAGSLLGHLAPMQGALWRSLGLSEADAVAVSGYQTASGLVAAAVRLGRIGAIEAQRVLGAMLPILAETAASAPETGDDIDLVGFTPLIEIAAMRHARAELRLFAN